MNLPEILQLKFPLADFRKDIILQDDGAGPYIKKWNMPGVPQPTQKELDQWAIDLEPVKISQDARQSRRENYPAIGDQLDMLYKAMDVGILPKVPEFYDSIKAVKEEFPTGEPDK